jgi:hypothetical protein
MRNLYNLIAVIAVAFTMFYLGKSCGLTNDPPCPAVDLNESSLLVKKLDSTREILDSIKEENREMDLLIVAQQQELNLTRQLLNTTSEKADRFSRLYNVAKRKLDTVTMLHNCDSLNEQFAEYRYACETFVQESDSIISAMYVSNDTKQKIINDQDAMLDEVSAKYTKEVYSRMIAQTGEIHEAKKKKRWRDIALVAGFLAIFGLTR